MATGLISFTDMRPSFWWLRLEEKPAKPKSNYAVTGLGGGVAALVLSLLPFEATAPAYGATTIGASAAALPSSWRGSSRPT